MVVHSLLVRRNSSCEELLPPAHIRRGIPTHALLANFGAVLRRHPDTRREDEKRALFALSEPTDEIDTFLSHSWRGSGTQKYLALLFDAAAHWALLSSRCLSQPMKLTPFSPTAGGGEKGVNFI